MLAREFWKTIVKDDVNILGRLIESFESRGVRYCIVGGQAVNAYAEPVVSLDLDIVVAKDQLPIAEELLKKMFIVEKHEHSINVTAYGSDLRVQIQIDPRYSDFPQRAEEHEILGVRLPVASLDDLLQGKVWAALDSTRRVSKRQKDLADIARLLESYPRLREKVPKEILDRLE
jgi:hypothetical protein